MPALAAHRPIPASRSLSRPPTRRRAAAPLTAGLALLAYGVIALALFPTVVAHLANAFAGDLGDPPSQAWILAWDVHALRTNPAHFYDANIFYPFHDVLAYQDTLLGLLPLAAPVLLLTGHAVLAYNVVFLLSFALCAWGAYLLARLLVGDTRAAFLAGLVYGFSSYRMVHLYHLNLLSGMWIPFALLCWERVRRGRRRYWLGVGVFFALQALSALYYAAFLAVALVVLLAVHLRRSRQRTDTAALKSLRLRGAPMRRSRCSPTPASSGGGAVPRGHNACGEGTPRRLRSHGTPRRLRSGQNPWHRATHAVPSGTLRRGGGRGQRGGDPARTPGPVLLRDALVTAGSCAVALLPFFAPYFRVEHALGASRGLAQTVYFAADLRDFLHGVDLSVLYGWTGHVLGVRSTDALQYLWPGAVALALALWGLASGRRTRRSLPAPQRAYAVLLVVAAILCLGPFLKVWGIQTEIPLPYLLLYGLPGFAGLRDPARFGAIYTLCLSVLAAYGVARLLRRRPRRSTLVASVLCAAVLAESWIRPLPVAAVPVGTAVPAVYRWLAAQPPGQPVLELPIGLGNKAVWAQQAEMMYYATYHWQPIVNGTGGFAPPGYDHDVALYNSFPATAALRLLRSRGVRYVIVHRSWIGVHAADAIRARTRRTTGAHFLAHWSDADVYAVR